MRETTSTEFVDWQAFFAQELNMPRREDYYLAQIAAEVRRTIAKEPKGVAVDGFMLRFKSTAGKVVSEVDEEAVEEDVQTAKAAGSKAAWLSLFGGKVKTRQPPPRGKV